MRMEAPPLALPPDLAAWRTRLVSGIREEERRFLETVGQHREEAARVGRVMRDIMGGFHELRGVERAVTVFGSARFKRRSAYYRTTMEMGEVLARAGYTVITGGGPGLMEAANRGAKKAAVATWRDRANSRAIGRSPNTPRRSGTPGRAS